ncbi:MAG TPA: hypothetical protein VMT91_14590 [Anaerolineales bacterium]|nr:hypothetical protein [Anaerolineales bacterium]
MKNIKNIASKIIASPWFYPAALFVIGLLAYGLVIPYLGFYWDDWESVYLYHLHNPFIIFPYFSERPFSAFIYLILFPFTSMTPLVWQVIALVLRFIGVYFIYLTLNAIWPARTWLNRWIGVLLLVFPGFLEQPVAVTYARHFTAFALFGISLYFTVLALQHRKYFWVWMPLSVILGIAQIFMIEYFVGLELIRPVLILAILWSEQKDNKRRAAWKALLYWSPFILGLGVYFWYRVVYLPTTLATDPNTPVLLKAILKTPLATLSLLAKTIYQDVGFLVLSVWASAFSPDLIHSQSKVMWLSWFVGIGAAILFCLYIYLTSRNKASEEKGVFFYMLAIGAIGLFAGAVPVWAAGRQIADGKWSDRFTLAPLLGAVILVVSIVDWLLRTRNQKQWLLAILMASSISYQIYNANVYRKDWEVQRNIYWQLAWRVPALKPGTAVIGSGTFTDKSSYYDGGYIVSLLFSQTPGANPQYDYFDIWHLPAAAYQPGKPLVDSERGGQFTGNTSQAIGMYFNFNTNECVRVLDAVYAGDPKFNAGLTNIIPISNLAEITAGDGKSSPDLATFGPEPAHGWCYYFEKADLARQRQDWQTILELGAQAKAKDLGTNSGSEYLPFIEAYAQTGQWSQAYDLSQTAENNTAGLDPLLCNNWQRFAGISAGTDKAATIAKAQAEFCGQTK